VSLVVDEHREYLSDTNRIDAFRRALRARVKPGDVVVDLGSGTGILGLLACQAGAGRVYAIESSGMIEVARQIAKANALADRIVYVNRPSVQAQLPECADGLVLDQIGHFGFEAGLFEYIADARRFLKPGAWIIPDSLEFYVAPVSDPDVRDRIQFWEQPVAGLDFSSARRWASNSGYPKQLDASQLLGEPALAARADAAGMSPSRLQMRADLRIERAGLLDGIGGWFRAVLAPGVELTNAPGARARIGRRNVVLPLERPLRVAPGDMVELRMQVLPADTLVTWRGTVRRAEGDVAFSHSTLAGMLLTRDDLRRIAPDEAPRLTERGRARLTVLELCDGVRRLRDIESEVSKRHPSLFKTPAEAAVFVTEVVSRYTE
jgi:protein arginine N-methyltransferase 1